MKELSNKIGQPIEFHLPGQLIEDINGALIAVTLGRDTTAQLAGITLTEREVRQNGMNRNTPGLTIVSDRDGRITQRNDDN